LAKQRPNDKVKLTAVTQNAQDVLKTDKVAGLDQAGLWGLMHLIGNENPNVTPSSIDLGASINEYDYQALLNEIGTSASGEDLAIRDGEVYTRSLQSVALGSSDNANKKTVATDTPVSLEVGTPGKLD